MNYETIQPNKVLRANARQQMRGVWKKMALAAFVLALIYVPCGVISGLYQANEDSTPLLFLYTMVNIAFLVVSGPFALGICGYVLRRVRGLDFSIRNLFDGFDHFGKSFVLLLLYYIFVVLWTFLLIIPGFVKALSYSQAFFILYDNPDMKPRDALRQSVRMMKGYKGKLFMLSLSFLGWILLGILTLGIGYLWLYPYMYMSFANFYENLKQTGRPDAAADVTAPTPAAE